MPGSESSAWARVFRTSGEWLLWATSLLVTLDYAGRRFQVVGQETAGHVHPLGMLLDLGQDLLGRDAELGDGLAGLGLGDVVGGVTHLTYSLVGIAQGLGHVMVQIPRQVRPLLERPSSAVRGPT